MFTVVAHNCASLNPLHTVHTNNNQYFLFCNFIYRDSNCFIRQKLLAKICTNKGIYYINVWWKLKLIIFKACHGIWIDHNWFTPLWANKAFMRDVIVWREFIFCQIDVWLFLLIDWLFLVHHLWDLHIIYIVHLYSMAVTNPFHI